MLTPTEEAMLIDLLSRHDTPTEVVRKALKADKCELRLRFGKRAVVVRDVTFRSRVIDERRVH